LKWGVKFKHEILVMKMLNVDLIRFVFWWDEFVIVVGYVFDCLICFVVVNFRLILYNLLLSNGNVLLMPKSVYVLQRRLLLDVKA
jgi:hypothetical protein